MGLSGEEFVLNETIFASCVRLLRRKSRTRASARDATGSYPSKLFFHGVAGRDDSISGLRLRMF